MLQIAEKVVERRFLRYLHLFAQARTRGVDAGAVVAEGKGDLLGGELEAYQHGQQLLATGDVGTDFAQAGQEGGVDEAELAAEILFFFGSEQAGREAADKAFEAGAGVGAFELVAQFLVYAVQLPAFAERLAELLFLFFEQETGFALVGEVEFVLPAVGDVLQLERTLSQDEPADGGAGEQEQGGDEDEVVLDGALLEHDFGAEQFVLLFLLACFVFDAELRDESRVAAFGEAAVCPAGQRVVAAGFGGAAGAAVKLGERVIDVALLVEQVVAADVVAADRVGFDGQGVVAFVGQGVAQQAATEDGEVVEGLAGKLADHLAGGGEVAAVAFRGGADGEDATVVIVETVVEGVLRAVGQARFETVDQAGGGRVIFLQQGVVGGQVVDAQEGVGDGARLGGTAGFGEVVLHFFLDAPFVEKLDGVDFGGAEAVGVYFALAGDDQAVVGGKRLVELADLLVLVDEVAEHEGHLALVGQGAEDGEAAVVAVDGLAYLSDLIVNDGGDAVVDVETAGRASFFRSCQGGVDEGGCLVGTGGFVEGVGGADLDVAGRAAADPAGAVAAQAGEVFGSVFAPVGEDVAVHELQQAFGQWLDGGFFLSRGRGDGDKLLVAGDGAGKVALLLQTAGFIEKGADGGAVGIGGDTTGCCVCRHEVGKEQGEQAYDNINTVY